MGRKVMAGFAIAAVAGLAQTRPPSRFGLTPVPPARVMRGPIDHGFGNVVFPGTGNPARIPSQLIQNSFPYRLGATVGGRGGNFIGGPVGGRLHHGRPAGIVPYAVPVFVGGYGYGYGYGYGSGYEQQQPVNISIVNTPTDQPSVIINQNYVPDRVNPVMREVPDGAGSDLQIRQAPIPSNPEGVRSSRPLSFGNAVGVQDEKATIYLIAFKDGTVFSSYAYWLDGETIHYITTRYDHKQASVDTVDAPLSEQLNRERDVEFQLKKR